MEAPIVTLTSDWGTHDYYAACVKGKLCSLMPQVKIHDLSHEQSWNDMATLMLMVRMGCLSFPEGTIHIIDVGSEPLKRDMASQGDGHQHFVPEPILAQYRGHFLICSELRPLSWALEQIPDQVVRLAVPSGLDSYSFLAHDLFCDIACRLATGESPAQLGTPIDDFKLVRSPMPPIDTDVINVVVTAIDKYGNALLNLRYDDFERARSGRRFTAELGNRIGTDMVRTLSTHYNDVRMGNLLLIVSKSGYLQLAVNGGSAFQLLGLRPTSPCRIRFYD